MKIIIVGGVAAGAKAAAKSRRLLDNDSEIILYTDDTHVSYSSCGIPYYIQNNFTDYKTLLVRSPEEFEASGVKIKLRHKVIKILPESKQILVKDLATKSASLDYYDKLILATGASPVIPNIKNVWYKNIFTVRTIEDAINIKNKLSTTKRAVILGGGYIGLEMLEALVRSNIYCVLIERGKYLMSHLDTDMSECVKEQLNLISENHFNIITEDSVIEFRGDSEGITGVITENGLDIDADIAIICAGVRPNIELATDCGIKIGETGAIFTNNRMETSIRDIYACGDCAETNFAISNTAAWQPLGSTANKQGRCAAINACGGDEIFMGVLGSAVTRCLKLSISMTGLTEKRAEQLGIPIITSTVTKSDKVGYMPDAKNITVKLIANAENGKLLGGQAVGAGDTDKRINSLTGAILGGLTVKEFAQNDLTYAPPFSTTIDPLLNAAEILSEKITNLKQSD